MSEAGSKQADTGIVFRLAGPADLPDLQAVDARWSGRDYVFDVLPSWLTERPGGVYLYELDGRVFGFVSITFPKPGEAWLRGKRIARDMEGRGLGTQTTRMEIAEAVRLGARVIRLATGVDNAAVHRMVGEKLGFSSAGHWVIGDGLHAPHRNATPVSGVRRISSSQWHNTRVRLAIQSLIERDLGPQIPPQPGTGRGPWGLIATPGDPWQLASFGPMDLQAAFRAGEVVVAGDPVRPHGVMFFREPGRISSRVPACMLRWLSGTPRAVTSLLDYAASRCSVYPDCTLAVSLPEPQAAPVLNWLRPDVSPITFRIYEMQINLQDRGGHNS